MDFPETFFEPNWENVECFNGLTAKWVNMIYFHLFLYLCHYLESCDRWKILTLVKIIYINIVLVLSVRLKPVRPSVRQSRFSAQMHIWVMNFQILLAFYRNKYLYMRTTAHTKFGCTAPTGNRVMALCYFQIYIVDRLTFCLDAYLGNGLSDFIICCRRFWGGYWIGVVSPSLPPTTDQVGKLSVDCNDLRKALVMAPR